MAAGTAAIAMSFIFFDTVEALQHFLLKGDYKGEVALVFSSSLCGLF